MLVWFVVKKFFFPYSPLPIPYSPPSTEGLTSDEIQLFLLERLGLVFSLLIDNC